MDRKSGPAISVRGVTKTFRIPLDGRSGIKQKVLNIFRRTKGYRIFKPLNDVSFEVNEGEFFGIVGRNGSGKSTLLKLIAGIYTPDKGSIKVNGLLVPFIELGVGFNAELTGRENIYLNAALMGFSRKETSAMYDEIVDFAELRDFMGEQLKNYSSGMQVRLAFSIAIRVKGDVLLLDEVLAVGDSAFQQKCLNYFAKLKREKHTVILVSHSMSAVEKYCDRALLLEKGEIVEIGDSAKIANRYEQLFLDDANKKPEVTSSEKTAVQISPDNKVTVKVAIFQENRKVRAVKSFTPLVLQIDLKSNIDITSANVGVNIRNDQGQVVFSLDTMKSIGTVKMDKGDHKIINLTLDNYYTNGDYTIDVHVVDEDAAGDRVVSRNQSIAKMSIIGIVDHAHSLFHPKVKVKIEK
jgi:ABC-2 type transport system ATP-binding protein